MFEKQLSMTVTLTKLHVQPTTAANSAITSAYQVKSEHCVPNSSYVQDEIRSI